MRERERGKWLERALPFWVGHAPTSPTPPLQVQVLIRKVRNKSAGTIGEPFGRSRARDKAPKKSGAVAAGVAGSCQPPSPFFSPPSSPPLGETFLKYDRTTGRYEDLAPWEAPAAGSHAASAS